MMIDCILDRFSFDCFSPEATLRAIGVGDCPSEDAELLLVESVWESANGNWNLSNERMQEAMVELIAQYKKRSIPTVFWAKEDPVCFERFAWPTPMFDYVFTTDSDSIDRHKTIVGHNRVYVLPFAAQPNFQFSDPEVQRLNVPCFAGLNYGDKYPERMQEIEYMLPPAIPFGLHLYDRRKKDKTGQYVQSFPEKYNTVIQPRVPYEKMGMIYRQYAVFLNIGTVYQSPTMFSRRVFEVLASGTPLVSAYAMGIDIFFGNVVHFARNADETTAHIHKLLHDAEYWLKSSLESQKAILRRHTYAHRFSTILQHCNLPLTERTSRRVTLFEEASECIFQKDISTKLAEAKFI